MRMNSPKNSRLHSSTLTNQHLKNKSTTTTTVSETICLFWVEQGEGRGTICNFEVGKDEGYEGFFVCDF